jgi:hypothetical protein
MAHLLDFPQGTYPFDLERRLAGSRLLPIYRGVMPALFVEIQGRYGII